MQWFARGQDLFTAMLAAIETAKSSVWLEMYWFSADRIGRQFLDLLQLARERNVQVRILYDSLGSIGTARRWFDALTAAGAEVVEFNPLSPLQMRFRLQRMSARNHRKLLIVDGKTAFLGGINIAEQWLTTKDGGLEWRDDAVCVRGPVVKELRAQFIESWAAGTGHVIDDTPEEPEVAGMLPVAVLAQRGRFHRRHAVRAYLARLRLAKKTVFIANAYFLPAPRLRRALAAAALRGVDVRIMLPGRSDVPLIRLASRGIWAPLLAAGVRIYEWQPSILHAKIAIIDGLWVTVGSLNLDYISLRTNRELNLAILDAEFASRVEALFVADLQQCHEVEEAVHRRRPLLLRALERVLYWGRAWL